MLFDEKKMRKCICVGVWVRIHAFGSNIPLSRPSVTRLLSVIGKPRLKTPGGQRITVGYRLHLHYCRVHARAQMCKGRACVVCNGRGTTQVLSYAALASSTGLTCFGAIVSSSFRGPLTVSGCTRLHVGSSSSFKQQRRGEFTLRRCRALERRHSPCCRTM
jgi:hypothetical protein